MCRVAAPDARFKKRSFFGSLALQQWAGQNATSSGAAVSLAPASPPCAVGEPPAFFRASPP